jgi:hypothetical protein
MFFAVCAWLCAPLSCEDGGAGADASRFPGNVEVCDAADVDEDCNQATFGDRDQDGDGWIDADCCNDGGGGARACGDDCDDLRTNA